MSCSCCCVSPRGALLDGTRKNQLLKEEVEEEEGRRRLDISALREEYRSSRERQKSHTQVLLFRKVSDELSDAVSIVPVSQTSWWEPYGSPSPALTFDLDPTSCDPWLAHQGLQQQRTCPRHSPLPSQQHVDSSSDSSCSSLDEEDLSSTKGSRKDLDEMDPVAASDSAAPNTHEQDLSQGTKRDDPETPITCSSSSSTVIPGSRRARLTRQLSCGGLGSSAGDQQIKNYNPFPSRKTWRVSNAARRLGMYSSF